MSRTPRHLGTGQRQHEDPEHLEETEPLDEGVYKAALEAWRREHDLWRRRAERADDHAAALSAATVTALAALGAIVAALLRELSQIDWGSLVGVIAGGLALLVALVFATFTRSPAWSVPKDELAEFHEINRTWQLWPFRHRGDPRWTPRCDDVFLCDRLCDSGMRTIGARGLSVKSRRGRTACADR